MKTKRKSRWMVACATFVVLCGAGATAFAFSQNLHDEGVGMYTDASVANQMSTFTINDHMTTCGVGTVSAGAMGGPFDMLMYSVSYDSYDVYPATGEIIATGRMRSITHVAGVLVEDVEHDFTAIAVDDNNDRFDVHFETPFWTNQTVLGIPVNPMCTVSTVVDGCRFGGQLLRGNVRVD